jgi:GMP synthase-like glutamine amidotransferase
MKPIAIAQHHADDGASYFATFMERAGLPYQVFHPYRGEALPQDISRYSGYCLLGGPMSANDDLAYLNTEIKLVLEALAAEIPVIGHCLGGQLIARALGGTVQAAENPEIGWVDLQIDEAGSHWFGGRKQARLFQWHGESFSIPRDGRRIVSGAYCANQAFQIGKHLAMQFHCEVEAAKVLTWLKNDRQELLSSAHSPAVQPPEALLATLEQDLAASQLVADDIYGEWIKGLKA